MIGPEIHAFDAPLGHLSQDLGVLQVRCERFPFHIDVAGRWYAILLLSIAMLNHSLRNGIPEANLVGEDIILKIDTARTWSNASSFDRRRTLLHVLCDCWVLLRALIRQIVDVVGQVRRGSQERIRLLPALNLLRNLQWVASERCFSGFDVLWRELLLVEGRRARYLLEPCGLARHRPRFLSQSIVMARLFFDRLVVLWSEGRGRTDVVLQPTSMRGLSS